MAPTQVKTHQKHTSRLHTRSSSMLACGLILLVHITVILASSTPTSPADSKSPAVAAPVVASAAAAAVAAVPSSEPQPKSSADAAAKPATTSTAGDEKTGVSSERKARADGDSKADASAESKPTAESAASPEPAKAAAPAEPSKPVDSSAAKSTPAKSSKQSALSGKTGASGKSKLPANLGTVTSTGSGGPTHYLSKHDAYSAIAEKHGSLAQVTSVHHKKSDTKRASSSMQRFGGIQKASGLGDMLTPFKGVTDSGLARTLGASMRSIMKGKYSVPAYVASALLGAVALMAFYESPMSPLPVPALPEPPIGRFPPEMPNISPNINAPFRTNGGAPNGNQYYGQNYNQRSLQAQPQQVNYPLPAASSNNNNQQQVHFPSGSQQAAQQRQSSAGSSVQQLAANLLSVGKQQNAQRKSGSDFDPTMARSFLSAMASNTQINSNNNPFGIGKLSGGALANSGHKSPAAAPSAASSFLSYFGLGGSSGASAAQSPSQASGASNAGAGPSMQTDGANGPIVSASSSLEPKAQLLPSTTSSTASSLSGSHLVNKVKSMFSRAPAANAPNSMNANNLYDQYTKMSLVQALMKDTAFLPAFLSPSRKSSGSPASSTSSSSSSAATSKLQSIANAISSAASSQLTSQQASNAAAGPAARMQVDSPTLMLPAMLSSQPQMPASSVNGQQTNKQQRVTSGHGLMRAADKLAHVLLETFTSGFMQKSQAAPQTAKTHPLSHSTMVAERKSSDVLNSEQSMSNQQQQQSPLVSATSLLSDIVSSYGADQLGAAMLDSMQGKPPQQIAPDNRNQQQASGSAPSARSSDESSSSSEQQQPKQSQAAPEPTASSVSSSSSAAASPAAAPLSRKTRSVGFEYPIENDQMIALREAIRQQQLLQQQQYQQQPSRAAQINNFVDFVSDSYSQNKMLVNFVMNHVGLGQAVPYVEQILASGGSSEYQH